VKVLVVLPVLVPLATAIACLALRPWRGAQRATSITGALAHLAVAAALLAQVDGSGIQVMQVGAWPAPFGISLVADLLAAIMVLLTGITAVAVAVYSLGSIDAARERHGYHPLFHVLLTWRSRSCSWPRSSSSPSVGSGPSSRARSST
jgi:multicomponent Na+:H+ antiporter subunit D